jgi:hypothetical protein
MIPNGGFDASHVVFISAAWRGKQDKERNERRHGNICCVATAGQIRRPTWEPIGQRHVCCSAKTT